MSYGYDVFVSYRRHGEWPFWVKELFMPLFDHWLAEELGRKAAIFVDYNIDDGHSWPQELALSVSKSRAMVALLTPMYFASPWCREELALMFAREAQCGFRTKSRPEGLVVPAALHDGDRFPVAIKEIKCANLQKCANVRIAQNSPSAEELSRYIRDWAPCVAGAINCAPDYDHRWLDIASEKFRELFAMNLSKQIELPTLG